MSNYNDTAESLPVNPDLTDWSTDRLRRVISDYAVLIPGGMAAYILTNLKANLESGNMSEHSALNHAAILCIEARIDTAFAMIGGDDE